MASHYVYSSLDVILSVIFFFFCILLNIGNETLFEFGYIKEYENKVTDRVKEMG